MIQCAIYPRKSKAVDKSDSMETQIDMCIEYLERHYKGKYTVSIYDGDYGITGHSIKKRLDFQRMMTDIQEGKIKLVLIQRFDRIARNTRDFCNLYHDMEQAGCQLISVSQDIDTSTPYGKNFMYQMAGMAELEWALCSERRKDIYAHAVKIGKCMIPDNTMPVGYKSAVIDGIRRMVKDEEKSDYVMDIFDHYMQYHNLCQCALYINEKYGVSKDSTYIYRIVNNPIYTGLYRDNDHFCEPYITKETFERIRSGKTIKRASKKKYESIMTGLLRCPCCGDILATNYNYTTAGMVVNYRCKSILLKIAILKIQVGKETRKELLIELDTELSLLNTTSELKSNKKPVKDNAEQIKKELQRLNTMYQKGRIDDEYYDSEYLRLNELLKENDTNLRTESGDKKVLNLKSNWKETYDSLSNLNKKLFLREIITEIRVDMDFRISEIILGKKCVLILRGLHATQRKYTFFRKGI